MSNPGSMTETIDLIQKLPSVAQSIITLLATPEGFFVSLLFSGFWLRGNLKERNFISRSESNENKRFNKMMEYKDSNKITNGILHEIDDQIECHYFKTSIGIHAEGKLRSAIIAFHDRMSHAIQWIDINRAMPYIMVTREGEIKLKSIDIISKIIYYINIVVSILLTSGLIALIFIFVLPMSLETRLNISVIIIMTITLIAATMHQNLPIIARNNIENEMNKNVNINTSNSSSPPTPPETSPAPGTSP